ncbi:hypothetical protein [Litorihabitans aurantiacus]|uniref:Uncharacterized protein n=1 Tax=Litorihabitans aurantiacus TaxID=1930061 RepID=A0AA37XG23_9MICO|nr:hypothetical protein [Litorihabitans aurantiacus]GMA32671.1 hypothetical protein GCM10025875_26630 [Litorihabitans aurantiacus]
MRAARAAELLGRGAHLRQERAVQVPLAHREPLRQARDAGLVESAVGDETDRARHEVAAHVPVARPG